MEGSSPCKTGIERPENISAEICYRRTIGSSIGEIQRPRRRFVESFLGVVVALTTGNCAAGTVPVVKVWSTFYILRSIRESNDSPHVIQRFCLSFPPRKRLTEPPPVGTGCVHVVKP